MSHRTPRLVVALLAAILLAPALGAAGQARRTAPAPSLSPAGWLRLLVATWLPPYSQLREKEGCTIDPNGRCAPKSGPAVAGLGGCTIDPNGHCQATATVEGGCTIDPDGHCAPGH
jgi:hypothetical protein